MRLEIPNTRSVAFWFLSILALSLMCVGRAASDAKANPKPNISQEEFDRQRKQIGRDSAAQKAIYLGKRLSIYEEYGEYVKEEIQKKRDQGRSESDAVDEVAGRGREERIAKARQYLLERRVRNEQDKKLLRDNFNAVKSAIYDAGFTAGQVHMAIPLIESDYDPMAFNIAERLNNETVKGMWQFTESTAKDYDLKVTRKGKNEAADDPDERYDPGRSSNAAKAYLDMLGKFDFAKSCLATEELILAAYHMGQGNVNKKIHKYGCDFWQWKMDHEDGFGEHSYNYPALVIAGRQILGELNL